MHFVPWDILSRKKHRSHRIPVNQHERILSTTQHNRLISQQSKKLTKENNNTIEEKSYEKLQV
jgi:hypothetical protein